MKSISVGEIDLDVALRGAGEPVLLVQTALVADEFLPLADQPALRDGYRVILHHRRGYGYSSPATGPGTIPRDADDCRDLLAALDVERAHVVGASYGAAVALQLAMSAPSRVHTLTVIEPPPVHVPNAAEFIDATRDLTRLYESRGASDALDAFLTRLMGTDWRADLERHIPGSAHSVERDAVTFFEVDLPALLSWDFSPKAARRIHQPILYIGGSESGPWFAAVRRLMADWLSLQQDVVIDGADHNLPLTHAAQIARVLTDFIAQHPIGG